LVRGIDNAMGQDREDKVAMRGFWMEEVSEAALDWEPGSGRPIFLTLPGSEGKDIQAMVESGILSENEVEGIDQADWDKVVAVESDTQAVIKLQDLWPGLRIIQGRIEQLVAGSMDRHMAAARGKNVQPTDTEKDVDWALRAMVVNLDYNGGLRPRKIDGAFASAVIDAIVGIVELREGADPFTLLLTLNGDPKSWPKNATEVCRKVLLANGKECPEFRKLAQEHLGTRAGDLDSKVDFTKYTGVQAQEFLMLAVPKLIADAVRGSGWRAEVKRNIRYGGSNGRARMVALIVRFSQAPDPEDADHLHRDNLVTVMNGKAVIASDGTVLT
jgi:hypothetical protein